jgi:hypothetical protein
MWRNVGRKLLGLAVLAANVIAASCHGFLAEPAARNVVHNSNYCPHCLPAGGPGTTYAGGRKWTAAGSKMWDPKKNAAHGVCGDPHTGPLDHEAGGKFATKKITGVYAAGQAITIRVKVTAPHGGRFMFGICPVPDGASPAVERAAVTQQCMDRNRLKNAKDGSEYWWFGKKTTGEFEMQFKLPDNIECKRCVLQWHWETGNSCTLPGTPSEHVMSASMGGCEGSQNMEEFWNCADVTVLPKGSKVPDPPKAGASSSLGSDPVADKALRAARRQQAKELRAQAKSLPKGSIRDLVLQQAKSLEDVANGGAGEGYADYSTAGGNRWLASGARYDSAGFAMKHSVAAAGWVPDVLLVVAAIGLAGLSLPLAVAVAAAVGLVVWTLSAPARAVEGYPRAWPLLEGPRPWSTGAQESLRAQRGAAQRMGVYEPPPNRGQGSRGVSEYDARFGPEHDAGFGSEYEPFDSDSE